MGNLTRGTPTLVKIKELADLSGFVAEAEANCRKVGKRFDAARFVGAIQFACECLLTCNRRLTPNQVGEEISILVRALNKAIEDRRQIRTAETALKIMSRECREWIVEVAGQRKRQVPCSDDWFSVDNQYQAFIALRGLLTSGRHLVPGRVRPGGKQSRPTFHWHIVKPEHSKVGRRKQDAIRTFIMHMRLASLEGGYIAPLTTHHKKPTSFATLIENLVDAMRITFSTDEMVNAWASIYYEANPEEGAKRRRRPVKQFPRNDDGSEGY